MVEWRELFDEIFHRPRLRAALLEIERLQQENKAWQNQGLLEQCNRQADEIERLRVCLDDIAAMQIVEVTDVLERHGLPNGRHNPHE